MSEFSIDPDAINRFVSEKIIESSIGDALRTTIDNEVKKLSSSYDNPMKNVVTMKLQEVAREYLETPEVKERLRKVVEEKLTDDVLNGFVQNISIGRL